MNGPAILLLASVALLSLLQAAPGIVPSAGAESTIIAAAIVTVISALVGGTVSVVNAISAAADRRASRQERAALSTITKSTNTKADTIIEKAVEIHTLTNSNLSKVTSALEVANEKIQGLEKAMATLLTATAATHAAAELSKIEVAHARAEQPPDTGSHRRQTDQAPLKVEVVNEAKVEVVNEPLVIHDAAAPTPAEPTR